MKKLFISAGFLIATLFSLAQNAKILAEKDGKGAALLHIVQAKEGLYAISRVYGVKVADLASANGFEKDNSLFIGQKIKIPLTAENLLQKKGKTPIYYTVSSGETLTGISIRFNKVSIKNLITWNNLENDVAPKDKDLIVGYYNGNIKPQTTLAKASSKEEKAVVTGSNINVRKGASTDQDVVATVQKDEQVTVLKKVNEDWSQIRTKDGVEGFIASQFIQVSSANPVAKKIVELKKATITGTNINIRKEPSTDQEVVGTAQKDEVVSIVKQVNSDWTLIRTKEGVEGYIAAQFLEEGIKKPEPKKVIEYKTAIVSGININIRKEPSTDKDVVGTAQQDDVVTILKKVNNEWSQIRTKDGVEGYVATQFLSTEGKKAETKKQVELKKASIVGSNINIRKGPSTEQDVIAIAQEDDQVLIIKKVDEEWAEVKLNDGTEGFVASKFLDTDGSKKLAAIEKAKQLAAAAKEKVEQVAEVVAEKVEQKVATTIEKVTNFKDQYLKQSNPNFSSDRTVNSGIFKTDRGWKDDKFYLLMDGPAIGSIVKVTNPDNNETIYAKVLGDMKTLSLKKGLDIRLSDAAAAKLNLSNTENFTVKVSY